jgi:ribosomal protein S18 acetylase RimI-like enzyme
MLQISPLTNTNPTQYLLQSPDNGAQLLAASDQDDVLKFLEARPLQTAYLSGLIRDNGVASPLNRGTFYGYRDSFGELEGVALIGHATLMETTTDRALQAFAETAQRCSTAHLIMCEETKLDKFWSYYATAGQKMRSACRQLLLELRWPVDVSTPSKLRLATTSDLELLIPVHAEMACSESGVDPRDKDALGFVERYARRISQGRSWVITENQKLIFKAEVVTETPDNTYIEGVWINPDLRRRGYGLSCMSQLARMLLWRTRSLCLFVNDESEEALRFYKQSGYHIRTVYDTIFMD